jgi:hypothetical protein
MVSSISREMQARWDILAFPSDMKEKWRTRGAVAIGSHGACNGRESALDMYVESNQRVLLNLKGGLLFVFL